MAEKDKLRRFRLIKGALALCFLGLCIGGYFLCVFWFRPPDTALFIATAAFAVVMAVVVHGLEPVFTAFALALSGTKERPAPALDQSDGETESLEALSRDLAELEEKKDLDAAELLSLLKKRTLRNELLLQELRKGKEREIETSS